VPSEGGFSWGSVLAPAAALIGSLFGGGLRESAPRTPYESVLAGAFTPQQPTGYQTVYAPARILPPALPTGGSVAHAQQPGTPPSGGTQQTIDDFDARLRRAIQLRDLLAYILSLFRKPASGVVNAGSFYSTEVFEVPYLMQPMGGYASGGMDFLGGAANLAGGIAQLIASFRSNQPAAMPGGAGQVFQDIFAGRGVLGLGGPDFGGIVGGGSSTAPGPGACPTSAPFRAGRVGANPSTFVVPNPVTGAPTWFKPAGRPLLWSGDLRAAKTVRRIARLAKRRAGGR